MLMASREVEDRKGEILQGAEALVKSGILTRSQHGNISALLPGTQTFVLTAGGGLADMQREKIALFDLDGNLLEGTVEPVGAEIVRMHAIVYQLRPDARAVLHTHSPRATGFAVAGRPIPLAYEALARFEMLDGVPLAAYGPRGSQQSVDNIASVLNGTQHSRGLLLENHGVLTFGDSVAMALRANMVIEEAAEIIAYAYAVGGPKPIPMEMVVATRERRATFDAAGTVSAGTGKTGG
jgi:L-fuculose-phosphate aldolase